MKILGELNTVSKVSKRMWLAMILVCGVAGVILWQKTAWVHRAQSKTVESMLQSSGGVWQADDCAYRVRLILPGAGEDWFLDEGAVFFVDFAEVGKALGFIPVTSSFRLMTPSISTNLPFSLDYQYGSRSPTASDEYRPLPDGFHSGEQAPLAEGRLRQLGIISFQPVNGAIEYYIYFNGTKNNHLLTAKSDASLRPWWINMVVDPNFERDKNHDGKPDLYDWYAKTNRATTWKIIPRNDSSGSSFLEMRSPSGGTLFSRPGLFVFDKRMAGRRVILYQQIWAEQEFTGESLTLPLPPDPVTSYHPRVAVHYHLGKIPAGEWQELCVEGRVAPHFEGIKAGGRMNLSYTGPCRIGEFHVQCPPDKNADVTQMDIETDIAECNDALKLSWKGTAKPVWFNTWVVAEHKSGKKHRIPAKRVEKWRNRFRLKAGLAMNRGGKPVVELVETIDAGQPWNGILRFRNIRPGRYWLRFEAISQRDIAETVAQVEQEVMVLEGPFTTGVLQNYLKRLFLRCSRGRFTSAPVTPSDHLPGNV